MECDDHLLLWMKDVDFTFGFDVWVDWTWFSDACPRSISSRWTPREDTYVVSARPSSSCLRNISTPVTTARVSSLMQQFRFRRWLTIPRSIRPDNCTDPVIENTSSTGRSNGLSVSRSLVLGYTHQLLFIRFHNDVFVFRVTT